MVLVIMAKTVLALLIVFAHIVAIHDRPVVVEMIRRDVEYISTSYQAVEYCMLSIIAVLAGILTYVGVMFVAIGCLFY